jgi:hypothetical protein
MLRAREASELSLTAHRYDFVTVVMSRQLIDCRYSFARQLRRYSYGYPAIQRRGGTRGP